MIARFAEFTLDTDSRQLRRGAEPLHLSRKAFDALWLLVDRRPTAVPKEELHARLWPGTFVVDANLSVLIAEIRRVLGDDPHASRFIRTVHRVGYAFCSEAAERESRSPRDPVAGLVLNGRVLPLGDGENLVGRDPASHVWIDVPGVSRRHARITLVDGAITLEDLGSKNGTFVGGAAIEIPTRLDEDCTIRFGPVDVQLRTSLRGAPTETVRI